MSGTPSRSLLFPSLDKRADAIPAIPAGSRAGPSTAAGCALLNLSLPQNPVYELPLPARVRDPAVALAADGTYELFFTHYHGSVKRMWSDVGGYGVRAVTTRDWRTFLPRDDDEMMSTHERLAVVSHVQMYSAYLAGRR